MMTMPSLEEKCSKKETTLRRDIQKLGIEIYKLKHDDAFQIPRATWYKPLLDFFPGTIEIIGFVLFLRELFPKFLRNLC